MQPRRLVRRIALVLGGVVLVAAIAAIVKIGPRNIIGMLRYDQRREGTLKVGDKAPDVLLARADGAGEARLSEWIGAKPLVLVFGSFT